MKMESTSISGLHLHKKAKQYFHFKDEIASLLNLQLLHYLYVPCTKQSHLSITIFPDFAENNGAMEHRGLHFSFIQHSTTPVIL